MAWKFAPISPRVAARRALYRDTRPEICTARYRIITDFYQGHPQLGGILRRALCLKEICEKIPVRIDEGDVIVGAQSAKFRACALYPENSVDWLKEEIESGFITERDIDPYVLSDENRDYILSTVDYWMTECLSARVDAQIPDEYKPIASNGVSLFSPSGQAKFPVGHFCAGYDRVVRVGFGAIKAEAEAKMAALIDEAMPGDGIDRYNFYRAVSIVSDAAITLSRRYAARARELYEAETEPERKAELLRMAECLEQVVEKPARSFHEALQSLYMYQTLLCLDANMHGLSFGRVDQYLGDYLERDLESGAITGEYAQELLDLFYLKVAEMNKPWGYGPAQSNPGYTNGMLMTLGGVKEDGSDATNRVTYMMLQSAGRLALHDPPHALRIHSGTPKELWEAAIETTRLCGGVPSFENDALIIPALTGRGHSLESARNYCLIGCVEPGGCGNEWPQCGGTGSEAYLNMVNALWLGINDGRLAMPILLGAPKPGDPPPELPKERMGLATGSLRDMTDFEQVKEAFARQMRFFVRWHAMNTNAFEYTARQVLPLPLVSATVDGCMDSGRDVMWGGARYNSTGMAGVGIGNVADSLGVIRQLCFEMKLCTPAELHEALLCDWKGYEELQRLAKNECRHYGNGWPEIDELARWAARVFSDAVKECSGPRGNRFSAGLYPVTMNVIYGFMTAATPDGRNAGQPLADGISCPQGYDVNGPTAALASVSQIDQSEFANGTLLNMKFSPSCLKGEEGVQKLSQLIGAYFDMGGMEMQLNVVAADTLRAAQADPETYKDLVVRVAGFSAYFVELHITGQNDLISRTELNM